MSNWADRRILKFFGSVELRTEDQMTELLPNQDVEGEMDRRWAFLVVKGIFGKQIPSIVDWFTELMQNAKDK